MYHRQDQFSKEENSIYSDPSVGYILVFGTIFLFILINIGIPAFIIIMIYVTIQKQKKLNGKNEPSKSKPVYRDTNVKP